MAAMSMNAPRRSTGEQLAGGVYPKNPHAVPKRHECGFDGWRHMVMVFMRRARNMSAD